LWLSYFACSSILYAALAVLVILAFKTKSLLLFYVFFERSIIPISLIIWLYGYQPEKINAMFYLLLYTVAGRLPLLLFIIKDEIFFISSLVISLPVTLGFMVKTPIYLLHIWLPKAHVEAPVGGSMLLAGILLKLGTYGLFLFLPYIKGILTAYLTLSLLGAVVCSLICLRQADMKKLIAYSSIVHMSFIRYGLLRGTVLGYQGALIMSVGHGICSPFLFAIAFWIYEKTHSRLLVNSAGRFLILGVLTLNIGVPPRLNLWSELLCTIPTLSLFNWAWPALILIFLLSVLYNLYFFIASTRQRITFLRKDLMALCHTSGLGYISFFCLDLFRI